MVVCVAAKESIAGVGRYINGYGEGVRRSMAADGPGAVEVKKSAVKATTASGKRASPSVGAAKTTGVAAGGAQRLTASTTPKVVAALPPKPASMTTKPATRSGVPAVQKLQSTATSRARPKSNVAARGKTIISAASKPRGVVAVGAAIPGARSMRGLGAASVQTRKPTAADPLALGSNIGSIGEKK